MSRTPIPRRALSLGVLTVALAASACTSSGDGPAGPGGVGASPVRAEQLTFVSKLRRLSSCESLLAQIKADASVRVGAYGFGGRGEEVIAFGPDSAGGRPAMAPTTASAAEARSGDASGASGSGAFSGTNVQEVGVDEPDIVKTDGRRILTVTDGVVRVIEAASQPRQLGTVKLPEAAGQASEVLWHANRVLVFGTSFAVRPMPAVGGPAIGGGVVSPNSTASDIMPVESGSSTITAIDLAADGTPTVTATLAVDGAYVTARQVGSVARVVVRSDAPPLGFVYPQSRSGEKRAEAANREVVDGTTLDDWLPRYRLTDASGAERATGQLAACDRVSVPTEFAGFGSVSVLTFDLTKPLGNGDAVTVMAGADTVYASESNLYVATHSYVAPAEQSSRIAAVEARYATSIHAFSITGTGPADYLASGSAPGHVLNQFALSEHDGHLRVATTKGTPWGQEPTSESVVTVLRRDGDTLAQVGQVGGLGKGERIYSVRYAGPIAYVVTFRQVDPFYTVDLSNPAAPKVLGELKIPGYSGYLHPISDTQVIGVGQDATAEGRITGTKVSLFDVSDLARPREVQNWMLPSSNSQAEFDHKAFLWWDDLDMLVLPVMIHEAIGRPVPLPAATTGSATEPARPGAAIAPKPPVPTAIVLTVTSGGITEKGRVTHDTAGRAEYDWSPMLRSFVAADRLWTLSTTTLQANRLTDLATTGSLPLR